MSQHTTSAAVKPSAQAAEVHTVNQSSPAESETSEITTLPIEVLRQSKTNPRRCYKRMQELTASIKQHGILEPLVVRPAGEGYEVVAGERRLRGARAAGLAILPVVVRHLTDAQVREIHLVENLQREDLEALEETEAYHALAKLGYSLDQIACKVSKSEAYVCQRMKFVDLVPAVRKAFAERAFSPSHAILIARLQAWDQLRALQWLQSAREGRAISVRELSEWVNREVLLDLHSAPFSKTDPALLAEAGACRECLKRVGASPHLYPDVRKDDTCTDPACFHRKLDAHIEARIRDQEQQGKKLARVSADYYSRYQHKSKPAGVLFAGDYHELRDKDDACPSSRPAIVVEGRGRGQLVTICASKDCKIHHARHSYETPQTAAARRKAEQQARIRDQAEARILVAVLDKLKTPPELADLRMLVHGYFQQVWAEIRKRVCQRNQIEPAIRKEMGGYKDYDKGFSKYLETAKEATLWHLLFEMVFLREQNQRSPGERSKLLETATRYKIDTEAITRQVSAELAAKSKEKKA